MEQHLPAAKLAHDRVLGFDKLLHRRLTGPVDVRFKTQQPDPLLEVCQLVDENLCAKALQIGSFEFVDYGRTRVGWDSQAGTRNQAGTWSFEGFGDA